MLIHQSNAARLMAREGAKHLYLLDFTEQVKTFAEQVQKDFPNTKVSASRHGPLGLKLTDR